MNTSNLDTFKMPKKTTKFHKKQMKAFLSKLGLEPLFPKFNKVKLFYPFMAMDVVVFDFIQDDFEMPPHLLTEMELFFYNYVHVIRYPIPERDLTLTLFETVEMARRFRHAARGTLNEGTKAYAICDEWIEHLWRTDILEMSTDHILKGLLLMCYTFTVTDDWLYGYDIQVGEHPSNPLQLRYKVTIKRQKAEVYNRTGDFLRRYHRLEYSTSDGLFLPRECTHDGTTYTIYFQPHALKRLQERVHFKSTQTHYQLLFHANYNDIRTYKGSNLIPLYINADFEYKIGYLVGELVDNRLLINTFLFLSADGTPEGDKLNELLTIKKLEKEYLQLDELRYFTNSDLCDDDELMPILEAAHLSHLFKVKLTDREMNFTSNAEFIKKMVPIGDRENPTFPLTAM